ncbi:putative START domain-containing protein [Helianthus annuus]|nr:putative START domain-containing protein [Helianthus annuus]
MDNMWSREFFLSPSTLWSGYTLAVVTLIFVWQIAPRFFLRRTSESNNPLVSIASPSQQNGRISDVITDLDLKLLMENLDEPPPVLQNNKWESVVDKRNDSLSYSVKSCKPKDGGPLKYLSTTTFNDCSRETLRDFYMDNSYRKEWDKTLIDHEQLQLDETNGTEFGRTIKKFPLLTPREYVLAWRIWEGRDGTYYCYSKECEHPSAPRRKKYVRVGLFRSGWRIREVPGRNSCQIKMVHQEDAGLNAEMAKMIFAKGIWSYVCKMDKALRKYSAVKRIQLTSTVSAITFVQKVPLSLDSTGERADPEVSVSEECNKKKLSRKPSKKVIANGLIIAGGVICLARGHTNFSAKVAMAYILSKLTKRRETSLH